LDLAQIVLNADYGFGFPILAALSSGLGAKSHTQLQYNALQPLILTAVSLSGSKMIYKLL